jgi:hypothetical protein
MDRLRSNFPRQLPSTGPESRLDWSGTDWIWTGEAAADRSAPSGDRWFRWTFHLPKGLGLKAAWLQFVAAGAATLLVNGRRHCACRSDRKPLEKDIRDYLLPGKNVFGVAAKHATGPAGWALELCLEDEGGPAP